MIKVSIIIVNYNTKKITCACLDSVIKYTQNIDSEIIVVDNNSQDDSFNFLSAHFPNVKFIPLKENIGFGPANNVASKLAKGEYLFFLNSDTILIEDSVNILYNISLKNNINILGCNLLNKELKNDFSYGNFPSIKQELFELGLKRLFPDYFNNRLSPSVKTTRCKSDIFPVDYVVGADLFIKRDLFLQSGGFDEDFFLYYEETELCFRLRRQGNQSFCTTLTSIIHLCGESSKSSEDFNRFLFLQMRKSKLIFFQKCYGKGSRKIINYLDFIKLPMIYRKFGVFKIISLLKSN